jgi:tetratricopeptide (TPR) repeat protein
MSANGESDSMTGIGQGPAGRPARGVPRAGLLAVTAIGTLMLTGCAVATTTETVAQAGVREPGGERTAGVPSTMTADVMYRLLVAEIAGRRGDLALALRSYLDVARETRDEGAAERAVRIAVFSRDETGGVEAAQLWAEIVPQSVEARQVLAAMLLRTGDVDGAAAQLLSLVETLEGQAQGSGYGRVAEILARDKDPRKAVEVMERIVAGHDDDPRAQFAFGVLLARHAQLERASGQFDKVLALEPGHEEAIILKARILQQENDATGALALLQAALAERPDSQQVRLAYARALVDAKRYDEARGEFERLASDDPADLDVQYALGLLLVQTNRLDEAAARFKLLVNDRERRDAAWFYLGQIAEAHKDAAAALDAYRRVDQGEQRLNAQIRVAVLLAESGQLDRGRAHLHGLRAENKRESVRIYRAEAEILVRREMLDEAMGVYDTALEEFAGSTDLLYARAMLAERLDELEVLERDLREILSREPNNADALNALGYTLADRTDRLDEALELISRAYDLKPDDHYVVDSMGWVLYRLGRYQEALKHLRRAQGLKPDAEVAAHLGEVLWVMGNEDEAREVWDTALKARPDDKKLLDVKKRFGL